MAFLKRSKERQKVDRAPLESNMGDSGPLEPIEDGGPTGEAAVLPPDKWLHMDVVEKEKLEWMTDILPTPPQPELDKTETRFSLDGLVIPRSTEIPSHLGLHHHGDEPQVGNFFKPPPPNNIRCVHFVGSWLHFG